MSSSGRGGLLMLGVVLSLGLIISTAIVSKSIETIKLANQTIRVKGSSERKITSDWVVWGGRFSARAKTLVAAYDRLKKDLEAILAYLERSGVARGNVAISSVTTIIQYRQSEKGFSTNEIEWYLLEQALEIKSSDIPLIARLSRDSTSLIKDGIEFTSYPPRYFYTKLNNLKIQMLGAAAKDARMRAEQLAASSGSRVGVLRSASQGVFQITPEYSTDVSDSGVYDTTSIEKTVKALVTVEYSMR